MTFLINLLVAGVTVTLPMETNVRGTEITLGEVATVVGVDAALVARIEAIPLGNAPAPGFSRLLQAHRIEQIVERKLPGVDVRFAGESACRVWPEVASVAPSAIRASAEVELRRIFAGRDVGFEPTEPIQPVSVPAGDVAPELSAHLDPREPRPGTIVVPVRILVDGTPYRTIWTSWSVELWQTLPVLSRDVAAAERIQPFMLESRRVKLGTGREKALSASLLTGAIAARDLKAGVPVTEQDVHRPRIVAVGDGLLLQIRKGAVTARVPVVARETGALGDRIRVETSAGREHSAVLVSRDLVEIRLGSAERPQTR